ncbi:MAG: sugar phosphate isomerase/epimerase [Bacteroidetes bacterium]|jgi:sugar phosphate isomerase/epimerase|nr:sugar phosphate isomerase/epimerase [Bacteroidota bacterium]MDF1863908.1 sugar phosphate isomerase/epimerase [Saprospiraceae bacterium]
MKLGFVSAILPELSLEEVLKLASKLGYDCVEIMCWPEGKAERRYAGVTHINVNDFDKKKAVSILELCQKYKISISALGYYPNPLTPNLEEAKVYSDHIRKVIKAAAILEIDQMNTFVGRDWTKSVPDNWNRFLQTWQPIISFAEQHDVRIGIENCPMIFSYDEWPGGKNLATTPTIWRKMFEDIPSDHFGLNYDPSHMIWQHMDYLLPIKHFSEKLFHIHAKDVRIDYDRLNEVGIMAPPNEWHTPKLPGMGDVSWGKFFSILTDTGFDGSVSVEVEDRAYEGSLEKRKDSLRQSLYYLRQFIPKKDN